MNHSIINALNLKEEEIDSIESVSSFHNEDFLITLKLKDHICPNCGSLTRSIKDYKIRKLHMKIFIRFNSTVYYKRRRLKCEHCGKSFVENHPFGSRRKSVASSTIINVLDALKPYNSTFSSVASTYGLSVGTVIDIFDKHVQISRKHLTDILCWDEFYFNRRSRYKYAFIMMDFHKKVILDILESRHIQYLSAYFRSIPLQERKAVRYIIIDMYRNYRDIASVYFPNAAVCIDPFHAAKRVNDALNSLRKRIMRRKKENKDMLSYSLLKNRYELLLKNRNELEFEKKKKDMILGYSITERDLTDLLLQMDDHLKVAYFLKERFIRFNNSDRKRFTDRKTKEEELNRLFKDMLDSGIEEMKECVGTLRSWKEELLNSFVWIDERRLSNGPIEGKNTYIKKIISNANGFTNFERARNKFLYSQNLYETYSITEKKTKVKRKGAKRGTYRKHK